MTIIEHPSCPIILTARDAETGAWVRTLRAAVAELARLVIETEAEAAASGRVILWTST